MIMGTYTVTWDQVICLKTGVKCLCFVLHSFRKPFHLALFPSFIFQNDFICADNGGPIVKARNTKSIESRI